MGSHRRQASPGSSGASGSRGRPRWVRQGPAGGAPPSAGGAAPSPESSPGAPPGSSRAAPSAACPGRGQGRIASDPACGPAPGTIPAPGAEAVDNAAPEPAPRMNTEDFIATAEATFAATIRAIGRLQAELEGGALGPVEDLVREHQILRKALIALVAERASVDKARRETGIAPDYSPIDLDAARRELRRRFARIALAAAAEAVSERAE